MKYILYALCLFLLNCTKQKDLDIYALADKAKLLKYNQVVSIKSGFYAECTAILKERNGQLWFSARIECKESSIYPVNLYVGDMEI